MGISFLELLVPYRRFFSFVGIVGGIGSGKTSVARCFEALGVLVLSADDMVSRFLQSAPVREEIREAFGLWVEAGERGILRSRLAMLAFAHPRNVQKLEAILHPRVGHQMIQELNRKLGASGEGAVLRQPLRVNGQRSVVSLQPLEKKVFKMRRMDDIVEAAEKERKRSLVVLDVPLLVEKGWQTCCEGLIFVQVPRRERWRRLQKKGVDSHSLRLREGYQVPLKKKWEMAHFFVDNSRSISYTKGEVEEIYRILLACIHPGPSQ